MRTLISWLACLLMIRAGLAAEPAVSLPANQAEAVRGSSRFAVELYDELRRRPGNLFFSPKSISTAFAMAYAGARGGTAAEISGWSKKFKRC
jgi:serine protease inhibitor